MYLKFHRPRNYSPAIHIRSFTTIIPHVGAGNARKYGCPADILELGRGSWRLLHTMAAKYPATPSPQVQQEMSDFIKLFANFYPCESCADGFKEW